jgi:tRNA 5-methylaminomethyl-2-thiouridine biosynthesis bifunctional protein
MNARGDDASGAPPGRPQDGPAPAGAANAVGVKALITPARIEFGDGPPRSPDYGDVYHPDAGALDQARHVFIFGNGLPARWRGRAAFTIVETGFGIGHNLLATLEAWHADAQRCTRLHIMSIDKHPPRRADLERVLAPFAQLEAAGTLRRTALDLIAQWPPLTAGMHRLRFDGGAVTLDLVFADVHDALRELVCTADAFHLDGFAPARNPAMWDSRVFRAVSRLAADDATAATWSVARPVRDGLELAGFDVRIAPGFGAKRQMLVAQRRALPEGRRRYDALARLGARVDSTNKDATRDVKNHAFDCAPSTSHAAGVVDAFVIGAGLAGAHVAAALAARGLHCTVLDRHAEPAHEASGSVAGIFHGTVHAIDGVHARLHRAASLEAARRYRALLEDAGRHGVDKAGGNADVPGAVAGLLRLSDTPLDEMHARIAKQGLPHEWVQALDAAAASRLAGVAVTQPCWFFPCAGWIAPQTLVRCLLRLATDVRFVGGADVARIDRVDNVWHALAVDGSVLASARVCVLAQAMHAATLAPWARWPLHASRGQSTVVSAATAGLAVPLMPVSSKGYAIGLADGSVLCGASAHRDDSESAPRDDDMRANLDKLARLTGSVPRADMHSLESRVAWRCHASDRMPIVGAVPARDAVSAARHSHARHIAREPGLYVLTALGSRGITLAPLLAEVVAASILREPVPVEASILDAIDAARFALTLPRPPRPPPRARGT